MFSCEFYKIFKNTLFTEHLRETATGPVTIYYESHIVAIKVIGSLEKHMVCRKKLINNSKSKEKAVK